MKITKAKKLELIARHFPWDRASANEILTEAKKVEVAIQSLYGSIETLESHLGTHEDKSKKRLARAIANLMGEVVDICDPIYSKFGELAPEQLKDVYNA